MVNYSEEQLNLLFSALADPTRRGMFTRLEGRAMTVTELARPYGISLPATMKHLKLLEHSGLVTCKKIGRTRYCSASGDTLKEISKWLEFHFRFWDSRLSALEAVLKEEKND